MRYQHHTLDSEPMDTSCHYCRNKRCRSKLPAPVENEHHAFCTRGCHSSYYLGRCLVCEDRMIRKRSNQRIKSGHGKCSAEYQRFPHVYDFRGAAPAISNESLAEAHSMGLPARPPRHRALRHWLWHSDEIEHELRDAAGTLLARLASNAGRHRLTHPRTRPVLSWPDLEEAKRRAESMALSGLALDPATKARIDRDNAAGHPMGPPANLQLSREMAILSDWKPHVTSETDP